MMTKDSFQEVIDFSCSSLSCGIEVLWDLSNTASRAVSSCRSYDIVVAFLCHNEEREAVVLLRLRVPSAWLIESYLVALVGLPEPGRGGSVIHKRKTSVKVHLNFVLVAHLNISTLALEDHGLNVLILLSVSTQGNLKSPIAREGVK